jgi:hypothetical protein
VKTCDEYVHSHQFSSHIWQITTINGSTIDVVSDQT